MSILESDASLLDGLSKPSHIVKRIKDIGATGCALTDHGSISNCISFLKAMKDAGKKPILGVELYCCDNHGSIKTKENRNLVHFPILSKNTDGWYNLVKLVSKSNENYYHRPRLSLEELEKYCDGNLIGFSGHLGSHIATSIEQYGIKGGVRTAEILNEILGKGNFWLECQLMDQKITPKQIEITKIVREVSRQTGIPCIATPDAHYAYKEDAILQRILLCSNMNTTLEKGRDPNFGMSTFFRSDCFHIPSYEEMIEYGHTEEELENTNLILSQIEEYDILKSPMLKEFECPNNLTPDEYLTQLCREGWVKLIKNSVPVEKHNQYTERVKTELDIIKNAKLSSYFLIVQDVLKYVNQQGWLPGISRGSVGGSLLAYLIGITKIDPLKHNLLFSRFYSSGRSSSGHISLPDIDVDVPIEVRGHVIEYIKQKYGHKYVSQIITFSTMKGAGALKEVFRAYGDIPSHQINDITKNIVEESKISDQLEEMENPSVIRWCLENKSKDFKDWCEIDKDGKLTGQYADRFKLAIKLEGTKKAQSKHAAGIVISPQHLSEVCPMIHDSKSDNPVAGFEMDDLESIGLMKLDILGVAALDKLMEINNLTGGKFDPDVEKIDFEDKATWDLISSGNTKGVFQLESRLGQSFSKKLMPENIEHLSALTAILRPGALQTKEPNGKSITENYIEIKNNVQEPTYINDSLKEILGNTYSKNIYQEQSMCIATTFAGFSEVDADSYIRKGIGKKKADLISKAKIMFMEGCKKVGILNEEEAREVFNAIEKSARYQFNASITESCLVELDDNTHKTINEVYIGDKVKTPYGYYNVVNKYNHGLQEVFEVILESGKSIECTLQHKFLCDNGKILPLHQIISENLKIITESD